MEKKNDSIRNLTSFQFLIPSFISRVIKDLFGSHVSDTRCTSSIVVSKLNKLYRGNLNFHNDIKFFLSLSSYTLTENQQHLLNLGSKYHFKQKSWTDQEKNLRWNTVRLSPQASGETQLMSELTKVRYPTSYILVSPELKTWAKQLRGNAEMIERQADKSEMCVVLDKSNYLDELQAILDGDNKFQQITSNPTAKLKTDLRNIIKRIKIYHWSQYHGGMHRFQTSYRRLQALLYIYIYIYIYKYRNFKTHKKGYSLRPVISQTRNPTYQTAKTLNKLLTPSCLPSFK